MVMESVRHYFIIIKSRGLVGGY